MTRGAARAPGGEGGGGASWSYVEVKEGGHFYLLMAKNALIDPKNSFKFLGRVRATIRNLVFLVIGHIRVFCQLKL